MNYLDAVSEHGVREAVIEGLQALRKARPGQLTFGYGSVVGQVARILIPTVSQDATKAWVAYQMGYKEEPASTCEHSDNRKLLGTLWTLVGEGILFPRLKAHTLDGYPHMIDMLTLTEKGERVVTSGDQHPLHPGFISRFRANTPTAPDEIIAHMEDAITCLEAAVLRPALMMLGLANEETIRITHAAVAHLGRVKPASSMVKARDLLADVDHALKTWPGSKDEQHRLSLASSAIEAIRVERNAAAHPGSQITDGPKIESLLTLAAHHLPVFWELLVKPGIAAGFVIP